MHRTLQENSGRYLFKLERDKRCQLSLIDARTGEELSPCSLLMAGQ